MATYIVLNLVFISIVSIALGIKPRCPGRPWLVMFIVLIILTSLFDNLIVGFDVVGYDDSKILNVYVGVAPIEDFMYAILAAILVPALWNKLGAKHHAKS